MTSWQVTPYTLPLLTAAGISTALALYAWRRRPTPGASLFALLMLAVAEWSLGYAIELGSAGLPAKVFWSNVNFLGIVIVPTAWLAFALRYTGREKWLTRRNVALLAAVPTITLLLTWTNSSHGLVWISVTLDTGGALPMLAPTYGTAFWVFATYSYVLLLLATVLLLQMVAYSPRLYRGQVGALVVGTLAPWVGNALHIFGLSPLPYLDLTPFAFTLTGLSVAWGLFRFRLFDLVPVARDAVVESMDDGVMVLDAQNRIVDINPAAARVIGRRVSKIIGQPAAQVLAPWPELLERYGDVTETRTEIALDTDEGRRDYDLRISPLYDRRGRLAGRLFVSRNIGDRKRVEELLQEERETFFSILQKAPYGVLLIDQDEVCLYVNPEFTDITGHTLEDIPTVADWFCQAFPDSVYRQQVIERWQEDTIHRTSRVFSAVSKSGAVKEIEFRPTLLGDGRAILVLMDITERRQAEEALRESEERFRQLSAAAEEGIAIHDQGVIVDANEALARMLGYQISEMIGTHAERYTTPESWRMILKHIATGYDKPYEAIGVRKDGSTFHCELVGKPFQYQGRTLRVVTFRDVTERKRAEEDRARLLAQIQEQAQRVQQIIATVPEGVLLLDADHRIVLANPVAEKDLMVLADARVGDILTHLGDRPLAELLNPPPQGLWHQVKADGQRFQVVARSMSTATGTNLASDAAHPEPVEGWVLVTRDVTQQREVERRLQQQERLAAVGQLAAGIAHDFNNIMATIVLYAQMTVREKELPGHVRERMATINQQAQHATRLILQILDFSRRAVLERRPLDLALLLREHIQLLKRTLPESIRIELAYGRGQSKAEGLGTYMVDADPTRMQQMVTNLAVNARDAMPDGGVLRIGLARVRIEDGKPAPLPEMEAGEWVQMTVSDTGMGIPPDILPHIFEPFFTTRAPLGSGLGLAQVHGIVAQHQGAIDVETQMEQGTTFIIYLPAVPVPMPKASTADALEELPPLVRGRGETILVAEDDAAVREALVASLEELNYRVLEAVNGQEALMVLEQHGDEIALVLTDVVMPDKGGTALLRALRERGLALKVVMLTGHPLEKELESLHEQGVIDWLLKPPSLEQLAEVLARGVGNAHSSETARHVHDRR